MADEYGVPARELTDAELERQGMQARASRHWVFLHGTAEQFGRQSQRMVELEQEYLPRHPQRTRQGRGGSDGGQAVALARDARIRDVIHTPTAVVLSLLDVQSSTAPRERPVEDTAALLFDSRDKYERMTAFLERRAG